MEMFVRIYNARLAIFTFILLLFGQLAFGFSSDYYISKDEFVHLSKEKQIEVINILHHYLTELETLRLTSELSRSKKKKYVQYQKLMNFFLNTAHASEDTSMENSSLCYYAGWISILQNGSCTHPSRLSESAVKQKLQNTPSALKLVEQATLSVYPPLKQQSSVQLTTDLSTLTDEPSCKSPKDIVCNPAIYGKKDGKAFCAPGNKSFGVNSSYICSKTIEKLKETDEEAYKKVMNDVITSAVGNDQSKDNFFETMRAMYDMCLCKGFSNTINLRYSAKMFNSRTCLGVIYQTQKLKEQIFANKNACSEIKSRKLSNEVTSWFDLLSTANKIIDRELQEIQAYKLENADFGSYSRSDDFFTKADAELYEIRNRYKKEYANNGLCPLDPNFGIEAEFADDAKEKQNGKIKATALGNIKDEDISSDSWVIEPLDCDKKNVKITKLDEECSSSNKKECMFSVVSKPLSKACQAKVTLTVPAEDGRVTSTTVEIPAQNIEFGCVIKMKADDNKNMVAQIEFTPSDIPQEIKEQFKEKTVIAYQENDLSPKDDFDDAFIIQKYDPSIPVTAKFDVDGLASFSCKSEIPKPEVAEKEEEAPEEEACSIKLSEIKSDSKTSTLKVAFEGETPEEVKVNWYYSDALSTQRKPSASNMVDDDAPQEGTQGKLIKDASDKAQITIPKSARGKRTVTVNVANDNGCNETKTIELAKIKTNSNINGTPNLQQNVQPQLIQRGGGTLYQGIR